MLYWDAETLWQTLEPLASGLDIEVRPQLGSTNTELLERGRRGITAPALLIAEQQNAGRGRLGRAWWSAPAGHSLTFSLGLRLAPKDWSGLSLAVGLALAEAVHERVGIKWPNDLWLRDADRKLGGILIEVAPLNAESAGPLRTGERWVVIGMGLNIQPQPDLAAQTTTLAAPDASPFRTGYACVQELDAAATAPRVLHQIAAPLLRTVLAFEREGLAPLLARYAARDVLAGRQIQAGEHQGVADGVRADGCLQLREATTGQLHALHSGEVSVRPC